MEVALCLTPFCGRMAQKASSFHPMFKFTYMYIHYSIYHTNMYIMYVCIREIMLKMYMPKMQTTPEPFFLFYKSVRI